MRDELVIGRIRSSFGIAGELKVESLSGETDHFRSLRTVTVRDPSGSREVEISSVRVANKAIIMKFSGIDTPEDASRLRGREIVVRRKQASPLGEGEFYYADLEGLRVMLAGDEIGEVVAIREGGAQPLLEIRKRDGASALVPFADPFFGEVRLDDGEIDLVDGELIE